MLCKRGGRNECVRKEKRTKNWDDGREGGQEYLTKNVWDDIMQKI